MELANTTEKRQVETVVIKVDNSKKTGKGKPYQRIQTAEDNLWRSHFGDKLEEGDRIECEFEETPEGYHNMNDAKKIGEMKMPEEKKEQKPKDFKPASEPAPVNVADIIAEGKSILGQCKSAVEEVFEVEKISPEYLRVVDTLFIYATKENYFRNNGNGNGKH